MVGVAVQDLALVLLVFKMEKHLLEVYGKETDQHLQLVEIHHLREVELLDVQLVVTIEDLVLLLVLISVLLEQELLQVLKLLTLRLLREDIRQDLPIEIMVVLALMLMEEVELDLLAEMHLPIEVVEEVDLDILAV